MAAATSSSHHATSSLNGEAGINNMFNPEGEMQESAAFPSLTPLSHDLELLSPAITSNFSVDDFLLSRTKASDLNFILSDLRSYSEKLKVELYSIINEDYKDFVSLGSSLKAEAHRIARLGWTSPSDGDHAPQPGLMAPVRDTLLASRRMLKSVQDDIEHCIKRREDVASHKARLELMLQLHDSIARLEDLLLIQQDRAKKERTRSSHTARRSSVLSISSMGERRGSVCSVASGSDRDLSDYAMSSEYEEDSDSEDDELPKGHDQPRRTKRKIIRRLSSGTHNVRSPIHTRDSADSSASGLRTRSDTISASSSPSSLLGLPQRIARTSAEYSRLRFLHRRIEEEGLTHYADALQDRIDNVCSVLRQDLHTLLRALLSPISLLVHGRSSATMPSSPELRKSSRPAAGNARRTSFLQSLSTKPPPATVREQATNELDAWSQIAEPAEQGGIAETAYWEARLEEQRSWLEMALTTLNTLTLVTDQGAGEASKGNVSRRNEAEEAVRDLLVGDWATKVITDQVVQTQDGSALETSKNLPEALQAQFQDHRNHVQTLLLSFPASNSLVELYNAILKFVASTVWHVSDASREISQSSPTESDATDATQDARCDVFTNVVWDELSSRLLDTMGKTIFFVGQTDTFYTNFTLTNAFLQRFLSLAPNQESQRAMQEHPNWITFKRRWQLPVYFQMRFREIVTKLEVSLADGRSKVEANGANFMLATEAVLDAIGKVWSNGVHIHELSAREWRVTLQILSRYKTWIEEQSPSELVAATNGVSNRTLEAVRTAGGAGSEGSRRSSVERPDSVEVSRVGTPQPAADLSSQQHEDEQLQLATELLCDCLNLRSRMETMLDEVILPRIADNLENGCETDRGMSELRSDLIKVLDEESLGFIPGLTSSVGRFAFNIISPRVAAPLRLLRSFSTPAYRQSSGNTNTSASIQVIHQIFAPIETFLNLESSITLPIEIKRGWTEKILTDVFKRYINTIETINKNQASLIRLKKSQGPSSGLLGLFKSSSSTTGDAGAEAEKSIMDTNKLALLTFENKIANLHLDIPLPQWQAWSTLKTFLESEFDPL